MFPEFNFTVFRPHNVYGPRQNLADKFRNAIGIFINQIMRGQPITIFGTGLQTRSFSYVDDVAPVIAASVLFESASNEAFFVGVDDVTSVNDLAVSLKAAMRVDTHPVRNPRGEKQMEVIVARACPVCRSGTIEFTIQIPT
jgi:UDP-glucose 4-epimerase